METFFDVLRVIFMVSAVFGGIFLLGVPIVGAFAVFDGWRGWVLRRVPERTVGALAGARARPRRVVVCATSVGEPTVAPMSQEECLWFRVTLRRIDEVVTDNGHDLRYETLWSETSGDSVWFGDGSGTVAVDLSLLERSILDGRSGTVERSGYTRLPRDPDAADVPGSPGLRSVVRRAMKPTGRTQGFELEEEVVRPGIAVTLFAHPSHRDGALVLTDGPGSRVGVSRLTRAEVADSCSGDSREGWWTVRFLLILGVAAYLCGVGGVTFTDLFR